MKRLRKLALAAALPAVTLAHAQIAHAGPDIKNELGMYTVRCQVVVNDSGNPIVGFVVGNNPKSPLEAEKEANTYMEGKFKDPTGKSLSVHKRHCFPQSKYRPSGAYDTNWNPK